MRRLAFLACCALPGSALAAEATERLDLTRDPVGWIALALFVIAYGLVVAEEHLGLRKSKPVMLAAALIWALIATWVAVERGDDPLAANAFRHIFLEFAELFFFLIVAMTYVNAMTERNVFEALRAELVTRGLGY